MPVDRTGGEQVAGQRAAQHLLRPARAADQRLQVDAGLDAHLVQHRDEVLGGDVAGRAARHRAAAELAERALERVDAGLERGEHVREPLAAGVVEVGGQLDARQALARVLEERRAPGAGSPCRSCRRRRSPRSPASASRVAIPNTRSSGTSPS